MHQYCRNRSLYWLLPSILLLAVFSVMVLVGSIYLSIQNINLVKQTHSFVGIANFLELLNDKRAWASVWKTIKFAMIATFVELILGLTIALFLHREFRGRRIVRTLMLIPMIMTPVVSGLIWRIFYDPNAGIINYFLSLIGIDKQDWLGRVDLAMFSVILADVWQWTPFVFLILASSLDALQSEPIEAAKVDGASSVQIFVYVVFPLLKPALLIAFLLRIIDSIKTFDIIYVMTRGGPSLATETTNMYAYIQGFNNFNISYASVININITLVITFIFTFIYKKISESDSMG